MKEVVRRYPWPGEGSGWADLLTKEWLVTNGLGGYASGTVCGVPTRRFHGLLVASLPAPHGRMMMLNDVAEEVYLPDGSGHRLGGEEHEPTTAPLPGTEYLREFRLDAGLPVWVFGVGPALVEKRVALPYRQNTVHVHYRNAGGGAPVRLRLRPQVHIRPHEAPLDRPIREPYVLTAVDRRYEISAGAHLPTLRLSIQGLPSTFTYDPTASRFSDAHDPEIHSDGTILFFDNGGYSGSFSGGGANYHSRVLEYQIDEAKKTAKVVWEFPGTFAVDAWYKNTWYSPYWGDADRLANGNILITAPTKSASASTRIFEVTRAGKVVWEIILCVDAGAFRAQRLAPPPLVEPLP